MTMTLQEHLVPVTFHLRQFNKYIKLDVDASEKGNLTLTGDNGVGKTTLANCFFPMLIDGSIATPSFNSAKGTEKLDQSATARNSARDTRNFDSMLLSWGDGAMKVRTGYSYMTLKSSSRQVILGIGAHRAVGDKRKLTWWFVAIREQLAPDLEIVTTDADGKGLDREAFKAANESLGKQLVIFRSADDYREYVAEHVYGFTSGNALAELTKVYRLLASPILTAGNARFTPIREALKTAQEGIDGQVIQRVANSQREVNRLNGVLKRIDTAQKRLERMRQEIFWRNLNQLKSKLLGPYTQAHTEFEEISDERDQLVIRTKAIKKENDTVSQLLASAEETLKALREKAAQQQAAAELREQYQQRVTSLQATLARNEQQSQQVEQYQQNLAQLQADIDSANDQVEQIKAEQLVPQQAALNAKSAHLIGLAKTITQVDLQEISSNLKDYLQAYQQLITRYHGLEDAGNRTSKDVAIVQGIQTNMGTAIDQDTTGALMGRTRERLHSDNQRIHEAGAAQMDAQYQQLVAQMQTLINEHPDLEQLLKDQTLMTSLKTLSDRLIDALNQLSQSQAELKVKHDQRQLVQTNLESLQTTMDLEFDAEQVKREIQELSEKLAHQQIDETLPDQLKQINSEVEQYNQKRAQFTSEISGNEARIGEKEGRLKTLHDELTDQEQAILTAVKQLAPYYPDDVHLNSIDDVLDFEKSHRSQIRNSNIIDFSTQVRRLIHRHDGDRVDRNALDDLFEERGYTAISEQMRQQSVIQDGAVNLPAFDLQQALSLMVNDEANVTRALAEMKMGNDVAYHAYVTAAVTLISAQYDVIDTYNRMLTEGGLDSQSIKLKVTLTPDTVDQAVIDEARNARLQERPALLQEVENRLNRLANNTEIADDDTAFMDAARSLLDTRQWSNFRVLIKRRQNNDDEFEEVDDKFVQSGGSGAEKAQAMVLPLLLVPKMVLERAKKDDTPYLVMFDEFADKLDPDTAKSFARTIANFGFNFIATMPSGAQNKILADGVENVVYDVIAPKQQNDGRFHTNQVQQTMNWR